MMAALALLVALAALAVAGVALAATTAHQRAHRTARFARQLNAYKRQHDQHVIAVIDLLGRTGAKDFQIRYSDDQEPTVWIAVARYSVRSPGDAFPTRHYQAAGGLTPDGAAYALLEQVLDGGMCVHCGRQTAVERRWDDAELLAELSAVGACVYAYDPETKRYRRSCEGDTR